MTQGDPRLPRAVAVVGPTAAGKEDLGVAVAQRLERPVLVCDSVKIYRRLDIGSAKPSAQVRASVPHFLLDLVDPDEPFTAGAYADAAWPTFERTGGIFVGGTGFYLRATAWTQSAPPTDASLEDPRRLAFDQRWRDREATRPGAAWSALNAVDPATAADIHPHNLVRIIRALWLCEMAGRPISALRREDPPRPRMQLMLLVLDPGVDAVDRRIGGRIDRMLQAGWLDEVEALVRDGYDERHKAMRSLGYRQLLEVVRGRTSLAAAREAIELATRHYARRQRTYMRHQLPAHHVVHLDRAADCPWDTVEAFLERGAPELEGGTPARSEDRGESR